MALKQHSPDHENSLAETDPDPGAVPDNDPKTGEGSKTATVESITQSMAAGMSPPSEHAIAAHKQEREALSKIKDRFGTVFDPDIHRTNPDGSPMIAKKTGRFALRPGRKQGPPSVSQLGGISKLPEGTPHNYPAEEPTPDYAMMGAEAAQLTILTGVVIGGAEFANGRNQYVGGLEDQKYLADAYAKFFEARKVKAVPPGLQVVAAISLYIAPRLQMPETKSRLHKIGEWSAKKFGAFVGWFKFKKRAVKNAQPDRGDDRERKDDAR